MTQHSSMECVYHLFDISWSMNDTNDVIWPFCKFFPGRTRGEHALEICRTYLKLLPNHHHRYFISFQGDVDEYSNHSLTLEQIANKYQDRSRPRYKSNIIQRLHNILQIMKNEARNHPNSSSRLLVYSDGNDNKSTQALKDLYRQTISELYSLGISVVLINFGSIGFGFSDADHYNSDDFPSGNMDQQVTNMLQQNVRRSTRNNTVSHPSTDSPCPNNGQSNIPTSCDIQLSVEEERQYQRNPIYVLT